MNKININYKKMAWRDHDYEPEADKVKTTLINKGYDVTDLEAWILWKMYSDSVFASWVGIDDDEEEDIFNKVKNFIV